MRIEKFISDQVARVEKLTGNNIVDFLYDVLDDEVSGWGDDVGNVDWFSVTEAIECAADKYIDFIKENYPEDYCEERRVVDGKIRE